ncbi:ribosome biogenesis protein SLX9 homolog [Ischnura elegans]|uniref:ribosome biogenesis protein SLX9 homolog n=1 Tax=Ischnura elegans TaxID=197161 RepID=UPI001ED8BB5C|nr:ribosome biogenesis protein SLX9 homolog [Ischnura elegans]
MGRLKRERRKFHLKAVGGKDRAVESASSLNVNEESELPLPTISDSIFSGISISLDEIKLPSEEVDIKSVRSWKSAKSDTPVAKKLKRKLRHATFMKKIDAFYSAKKEEKLAAKRQKTVITGDMKPLLDALPDFSIPSSVNEEIIREKCRKKRSTPKATGRKNEMLANIATFRSLMRNPKFQENPLEMVNKNIIHHVKIMSEENK